MSIITHDRHSAANMLHVCCIIELSASIYSQIWWQIDGVLTPLVANNIINIFYHCYCNSMFFKKAVCCVI